MNVFFTFGPADVTCGTRMGATDLETHVFSWVDRLFSFFLKSRLLPPLTERNPSLPKFIQHKPLFYGDNPWSFETFLPAVVPPVLWCPVKVQVRIQPLPHPDHFLRFWTV